MGAGSSGITSYLSAHVLAVLGIFAKMSWILMLRESLSVSNEVLGDVGYGSVREA